QLTGYMKNQTGFAVDFSGSAPVIEGWDSDGTEQRLYSDFYTPKDNNGSDLWSGTLQPGQTKSFSSLPVQFNPAVGRWNTIGWNPIVQFRDDKTIYYCNQRAVPTYEDLSQ